MKNKYIFLIALIILIVDLIPVFGSLDIAKVTAKTNSDFKINKKHKHACNKLKKEINDLFSSANFCTVDSDCILSDSSSCLFHCNSLVNKTSDTTIIKEKISKYSSMGCAVCNIDCISPPAQENIKCQNNKCIDDRIQN